MSAPSYLIEAGIYLSAAVIAVPLFKRFGLGSVLGYLIAGIIIGPSALQLIDDPERVLHFAEFGVVLLLFLIGLELEPERAWAMRRPIFGLGGLQVMITIAVVFGAALFFGWSWQVALVAGMGAAMSSTAIGLALLEERKLLTTPCGQASFAVLLFQDLAVIPLFMVLALMAPQPAGDVNGAFDLWAAGKALVVVALIIVASRTVVRPLLRIVARTGLREIFIAFALLLVIGVALAVQSVGLSMALGTFLAGLLLADSEYRYELQLDIEPAKGLLLGLFFIAVGMSVDLAFIARQPWLVLGLVLAVVVGKAAVLLALARVFHAAQAGGRLFAIGLSQVGEFAFVIFNLALGQGTLERDTFNLLNAVVAVSMLSTPLLLVAYDRLMQRQTAPHEADAIDEENPVIVAGFGRFGQVVVRVLDGRGIKATLIDHDPDQIQLMRDFGWRCYYGDASRLDVLRHAGIDKARLFVLAIDDSEVALRTARLVRERWPQVPILARAHSRTDAFLFRDLGIDAIREVFHSSLEGAAQALMVLGDTPQAARQSIATFERMDREFLERANKVRGDHQAVINVSQQGRRDLQALLASERAERAGQAGQSANIGSEHMGAGGTIPVPATDPTGRSGNT